MSIVPFPSTRVFRADLVASSGADLDLALRAAFDDAAKAKVSVLLLDGLETLLGIPPGDVGFVHKGAGYSLSGGRFGTAVGSGSPSSHDSGRIAFLTRANLSEKTFAAARSLRALLRRPPPRGRNLAVVATSSSPETLRALGVSDAFHAHISVPALSRVEAEKVLAASGAFGEDDGEKAAEFLSSSTPIKVLLRAVSIARALEKDEASLGFGNRSEGGDGARLGVDPTGEAWITALRRVNLTSDDQGVGGVFR
jgi:vesicle-fusing ATPase